MRVWAGDEVKIDDKELENDAMEGVESAVEEKGKASGSGSLRSQSMSVSATSADDLGAISFGLHVYGVSVARPNNKPFRDTLYRN